MFCKLLLAIPVCGIIGRGYSCCTAAGAVWSAGCLPEPPKFDTLLAPPPLGRVPLISEPAVTPVP